MALELPLGSWGQFGSAAPCLCDVQTRFHISLSVRKNIFDSLYCRVMEDRFTTAARCLDRVRPQST